MRTAWRPVSSVATDDGHLQAELQERTVSLVALQRNYEVISRVLQQKQQEYDALKKEYDEESRRAMGLGVRLDDALTRAQKAESGAARLHAVEAQLSSLQKQNVKLVADLEAANSSASSNTNKVKNLQKLLEESEFKASSIRRESMTWQNSVAAAKDDSKKMTESLQQARGEILAFKRELIGAREASSKSASQRQSAEAHAAHLELVLQNRDEQQAGLKDTIRQLQDDLDDSRSAFKALQVTFSASKHQCSVAEEQAQSMCRSLTLASESQRAAEANSQLLESKLHAMQESVRERDAKISQLKYLLDDAEERYQDLLTRGMEDSEGLARLNMQLAQSKALAGAAQEELEKTKSDHALSLDDARFAARTAEQHAAETAARSARVLQDQVKYLEGLVSQVDGAVSSISAFQADTGRTLGELSEKQERSLHVLECRLQKMQIQWTGVEDIVSLTDATMSSLSKAMSQKEFKQVDAADAAQMQVTKLEGLLKSEQAARQSLIQEKREVEAKHREALSAVQATADERLEAERQRLNIRLRHVESGVMQLKATCQADLAEAKRMLELEKKQMDKQLQMAKAESAAKDQRIVELLEELNSAGEQEIGALSTRHMEEIDRLKQEHTNDMTKQQAKLQAVQSNVRAAWDAGRLLHEDMLRLNKHLKKMGWDSQQLDKGAELAKDAKDGTGGELVKACTRLRLHFSHITVAVQEAIRKASKPSPPPPAPAPPSPSPEQTTNWKALAKELHSTVQKLVHVEEALASNCTCMLCLEVFKQPITCVPGGHTYCKACFEAKNFECDECGMRVSQTVANTALEAICSKSEFKQQALKSIHQAIAKATAA